MKILFFYLFCEKIMNLIKILVSWHIDYTKKCKGFVICSHDSKWRSHWFCFEKRKNDVNFIILLEKYPTENLLLHWESNRNCPQRLSTSVRFDLYYSCLWSRKLSRPRFGEARSILRYIIPNFPL